MTVRANISAAIVLCFCVIAAAQDSSGGDSRGPAADGGSPGMERGGILSHNRAEDDLKKKRKKKAEEKARAAKAKQQQKTGAGQTNGQPNNDHGATQIPVVMPEATPPPKKVRPWTIDFYYEDYWAMIDADHHTGTHFTDGYIGGTYRVGPNTRLYIRQNALLNIDLTGSKEFEYTGRLSDTEFGVYQDNIFTWAGGGSFNAYTRFYLSSGYKQWAVDAPEDSGQIFRFRPEFITSQPLGKYFEVGHIIDPRVMANQRNGQTVDDGTGKMINQANASYKFNQFFYLTGRKAPFSSTFILGTYDYWYNKYTGPDGQTPQTHHSYMYTDMSFTWQIIKQVSVTIGIENDMQTDRSHPYETSWLRERETYYYLNSFMRF